MARTAETGTAERILDVAEALVQSRGFNGFSYADVAESLGISKAALHYHYPGKAELGEALIERYARRFGDALAAVDRDEPDATAKLRAYARLYADVFQDDRMCLCGMLAAEYATLPKAMQQELRHYFAENERWLAAVLDHGRRAGELAFKGSAREAAGLLVSSLEGAMMLARSQGNTKRFGALAERLIAGLAA